MKDLFKGVKGHFKAERLDAFDNVIDTPVDDHNMIMTSARTSMAEIFAHLTNVDLSNAFYFGTLGHKEPNIYLPKDSGDGFTKDRRASMPRPSRAPGPCLPLSRPRRCGWLQLGSWRPAPASGRSWPHPWARPARGRTSGPGRTGRDEQNSGRRAGNS